MTQDSTGIGKATSRNPWRWVPTLYLAQGLPFAVVSSVSVLLYKSLGVSNADIAFYTAWLYLPWVIKPLWSPVVDILRTRRWWIWATQLLLCAGFAMVALSLPTEMFFKASLAVFYLIAFSSATHDIAADGYYLLATTEKEQSFFVGIRSTYFRISMIFGQGLLVILAGLIQSNTGLPKVDIRVEATPGVALVEKVTPAGLMDNFESATGMKEAAALRIMAARVRAPFDGAEDLARGAELDQKDMRLLAGADALASLAGHRRQQVWEASALKRPPQLLRDAPVDEALLELPPALEGEEVVHDYATIGLTLRSHPLALLHPRLAERKLATAATLEGVGDGRFVRYAGIVTLRQQPETASGTIFMSLEDETGVVQVIVWRSLRERQRPEVLRAKLLEGTAPGRGKGMSRT